jgi:hypothetical protein
MAITDYDSLQPAEGKRCMSFEERKQTIPKVSRFLILPKNMDGLDFTG